MNRSLPTQAQRFSKEEIWTSWPISLITIVYQKTVIFIIFLFEIISALQQFIDNIHCLKLNILK